jgi:CheY-like chemotaxis protein
LTGRKVVLVVEDSPDCAATLELALAPLAGVEVRVVGTAEEALAAVERTDVAAVVTDFELPGMDGLEFVARLRGERGRTELPVVMISGAAARDISARALYAGVSAFFSKPFSPAAIRQRLEGLIDAY